MHDHFFRYGHFLWFVGAIVCSILRLFLGAGCHCFEYWVEREHPQPESHDNNCRCADGVDDRCR